MKNYLTRIKKSFILGLSVSLKYVAYFKVNPSGNLLSVNNPLVATQGVLCYSKTFTKPNYAKLSTQKIAQKKFTRESEKNKKELRKTYNYSLAKKIPIVKGKFENSYLTSKTRDLTESECQILTNLVEINQGNIPISWEQFYLLTGTNFFTFNQTYKKY